MSRHIGRPTRARSAAESTRPRGAHNVKRAAGNRGPRQWLARHLQNMFGALGRICHNAVSSLMTIAVIGIALALPGSLALGLKNLQNLLDRWDTAPQVSLYLTPTTTMTTAERMARELRTDAMLSRVDIISPDEALAELADTLDITGLDSVLERNPLPIVLVARLKDPRAQPFEVQSLYQRLTGLPDVEQARLDMDWVKRIYGYLQVAERAVLVISVLLSLSVLLIIGNTIRLEILNRRDEIVICKLIGATNAFIRRPFLYTGIWYGVLGSVLAAIVILLGTALMNAPVEVLAAAYNSDFSLSGLSPADTLLLLSVGVGLGLFGAWLSVSRHLHRIEPE